MALHSSDILLPPPPKYHSSRPLFKERSGTSFEIFPESYQKRRVKTEFKLDHQKKIVSNYDHVITCKCAKNDNHDGVSGSLKIH